MSINLSVSGSKVALCISMLLVAGCSGPQPDEQPDPGIEAAARDETAGIPPPESTEIQAKPQETLLS